MSALARSLLALSSLVAAHTTPAHHVPKAKPPVVRCTDATCTNTPDWACIRWHESTDNYRAVGDQYGAYQFTLQTWDMLGYSGYPNLAPPWEQNQAALRLWHWDLRYTGNPWSAWQTAPLCGL